MNLGSDGSPPRRRGKGGKLPGRVRADVLPSGQLAGALYSSIAQIRYVLDALKDQKEKAGNLLFICRKRRNCCI